MYQRMEGAFLGHDQLDLYYQSWVPQKSEGTLIITHGLGEHSESYVDFIESLKDPKWLIHGWDLRGHGRSEGKRGVVGSFSDYIKDMECFVRSLRETKSIHGPLLLLGHSMGGLITLKYVMERGDETIQAICLNAPALGVSMEVPKIKEQASHILAKYLPWLTLSNGIDYHDLTHFEELVAAYEADPLRHDRISAQLYLGMVESMEWVFERANLIKLPILFQLAGEDRIVSTKRSEQFFDLIASQVKHKYLYERSYHQIFNDICKEEATADFERFIRNYV